MNGSLALVGSGEYLPAMTTFERSLLDDGIKNGKQPNYIQIPTAAGRFQLRQVVKVMIA